MILGDFHTHSLYSDGTGTIEQNYRAAEEKGLKQLGCTEHGLGHIAYGAKRKDFFAARATVDKLNENGAVEAFLGIEANIISSDGDIDLKPSDFPWFDFIIAGYHKTSFNPNFVDFFRFNINGLGRKNFSAAEIKRFTRAYLAVIRSGKADIISHLFYGLPVDTAEIAKAAGDYGVLIELNGKKVSIPDDDVRILCDNPYVKFIVNSDAHSPERVGEVSVPLAVVERLNVDKNRIVNWDKLLYLKRK